jgi:hypothetical protein
MDKASRPYRKQQKNTAITFLYILFVVYQVRYVTERDRDQNKTYGIEN